MPSRDPRPPIHERRAERELFFWTIRQVLLLVLLAASVAAVVLALIDPHEYQRLLPSRQVLTLLGQ